MIKREIKILEMNDISTDMENPTILYLTKVSTAKGRLDIAKYETKFIQKDNKLYSVGSELNNQKLKEIISSDCIILDKLFLSSVSEGMFNYLMLSLDENTTCNIGIDFDKILESFPNTPEDYRLEYNQSVKN